MIVSWIKYNKALKDLRNGHQKKAKQIAGYTQPCPEEQHPNFAVSKADLSCDKLGSGNQQ